MDYGTCKECGGDNTYWYEEHADTGMDEMVLRCRDCEAKEREKWKKSQGMWCVIWANMKWNIKCKFRWWLCRNITPHLFRLARWAARHSADTCTWCGRNPGFSSMHVGGKGLRCYCAANDCVSN